jgi:hypothetical protein
MRANPFNKVLGKTGSEDTDLFGWLHRQGFKFVWSAHAEVFERIEEKRQHLRWHFIRGYRGGWAFSYQLAERYGRFISFFLSAGRIIPAALISLLNFAKSLKNPRAALYRFSGEIGGHFGKLGYFVNIKKPSSIVCKRGEL